MMTQKFILNGTNLKISINNVRIKYKSIYWINFILIFNWKDPPYTYLRKNDSTNILEFVDGIEFYYLNTLCEFFNFTYSIIDENQEYGAKLANGEWNGIIGRISRNVRNFDTLFMIIEMIYSSVKILKKKSSLKL